MPVRFTVNGEPRDASDSPETPLLWVLRDALGLTGTKFGCGIAQCGACTVLLDGAATRSCSVAVAAVEGKSVTTIEALADDRHGAAVQRAWLDHQVPQCGYCQSGFVVAVTDLLKRVPAPTDAEIDRTITNLCRCGTQPRMKAAVRSAVAALGGNP